MNEVLPELGDLPVGILEFQQLGCVLAECRFTADGNRPTHNDFRYVKCGSETNTDYNATKNIGL